MIVYVHTHMNDARTSKCLCSLTCILTSFAARKPHLTCLEGLIAHLNLVHAQCFVVFSDELPTSVGQILICARGIMCLLIRSHEFHKFLYPEKKHIYIYISFFSAWNLEFSSTCLTESRVFLQSQPVSMHRQKLLENFMDWTKVGGAMSSSGAVKTRLECWRSYVPFGGFRGMKNIHIYWESIVNLD